MPDGHMIHVDARRFDEAMAGHVVHTDSPFGPGAGARRARSVRWGGAGVLRLFLRFSGDSPQYLHVHLGLIGGWTWWDHDHQQLSGRPVVNADSSNVRLRLRSGRGDAERSAELRGATTCTLVDEEGLDRAVAELGPDPLRDDADPSLAWAKVRKSKKPIGGPLLDQGVTAGAGLIWRAEVPFLAGVDPHRPGVDVTEDEFTTMWSEMRRVMSDAVERGGKEITTAPEDRPETGGHVGRDDAFDVFRRDGEPCLRCGTEIRVAEMGTRKVGLVPHMSAPLGTTPLAPSQGPAARGACRGGRRGPSAAPLGIPPRCRRSCDLPVDLRPEASSVAGRHPWSSTSASPWRPWATSSRCARRGPGPATGVWPLDLDVASRSTMRT